MHKGQRPRSRDANIVDRLAPASDHRRECFGKSSTRSRRDGCLRPDGQNVANVGGVAESG